MRRFVVRVSNRAQAIIDRELDWWNSERSYARVTLAQELENVMRYLRAMPWLGYPTLPRAPGRHTKLLPKTQYWLRYLVDEREGIILVTGLVHTSRRRR